MAKSKGRSLPARPKSAPAKTSAASPAAKSKGPAKASAAPASRLDSLKKLLLGTPKAPANNPGKTPVNLSAARSTPQQKRPSVPPSPSKGKKAIPPFSPLKAGSKSGPKAGKTAVLKPESSKSEMKYPIGPSKELVAKATLKSSKKDLAAAEKAASALTDASRPKATSANSSHGPISVSASSQSKNAGRAGKKSAGAPRDVLRVGTSFRRSSSTETMCREVACEGLSTAAGYCRMHYIKNWSKIQRKAAILKERKLNQFIEELVLKYPDKYLEAIRQDLENDNDFAKVVSDLELDEGADEFEADSDEEAVIEDIRRDFGGEDGGGSSSGDSF